MDCHWVYRIGLLLHPNNRLIRDISSQKGLQPTMAGKKKDWINSCHYSHYIQSILTRVKVATQETVWIHGCGARNLTANDGKAPPVWLLSEDTWWIYSCTFGEVQWNPLGLKVKRTSNFYSHLQSWWSTRQIRDRTSHASTKAWYQEGWTIPS